MSKTGSRLSGSGAVTITMNCRVTGSLLPSVTPTAIVASPPLTAVIVITDPGITNPLGETVAMFGWSESAPYVNVSPSASLA